MIIIKIVKFIAYILMGMYLFVGITVGISSLIGILRKKGGHDFISIGFSSLMYAFALYAIILFIS